MVRRRALGCLGIPRPAVPANLAGTNAQTRGCQRTYRSYRRIFFTGWAQATTFSTCQFLTEPQSLQKPLGLAERRRRTAAKSWAGSPSISIANHLWADVVAPPQLAAGLSTDSTCSTKSLRAEDAHAVAASGLRHHEKFVARVAGAEQQPFRGRLSQHLSAQ
jgi:hypothetical protein